MKMRPRKLSATLRHALYGGAALWLFAAAPAMADGTGQDTGNTTAAKKAGQQTANAAKAQQLGNITVTAQSRTQQMEQVPIALQILTAQQINTQAATDLSKISLFVPGLVVDGSQPTQPNYSLRGISTSDFGIGTESAVGVYIDGVYAARSGGALLAFNDIDRIEVLKGPQGTLFGRNAAGGAISIVTNEPTDKFEGKVVLRYGNEGERYEDALVNIPLNKDMALRISVLDNQSDGWIRDQANGQHYGKNDDWGTRVVYRWNITPDTRVLWSWDHERLDQPPRPAVGLIPLSSDTNERPPYPPNPATYLNPLTAPLYNDAIQAREWRHFDGSTLIVDHSFSWGSFTSTTAWRHFNTFNDEDNDGTDHVVSYLDTANIEHNNSYYQEFKLAGDNDLMDWVSGVSFYSEQARQTSQVNTNTSSLDTLAQNVDGLGLPLTEITQGLQALGLPYSLLGDPWREEINNVGKFKAYAAFGDVIWHLNDQLDLTTGLRYTEDQKDFTWYTPPRQATAFDQTVAALVASGIYDLLPPQAQQALGAFGSNIIFPNAVGQWVATRHSWHDFSPRAVLSYKFTPDLMAYISATKGYKAGGYNSLQVGSLYAPEKVWNYETGVKAVFPEYNLLLNASAYYYRYSNLQSSVLNSNFNGSGVPFYTVMTSDQHAHGLDVEAQWQPVQALRLNFTSAYIDSTYTHGTSTSGVSLDGQPTGEPFFSATAGFDYTWFDVYHGNLELNMQYAYRGRTRCNADSGVQGTCLSTPLFSVGTATQRTDARLDWHTPDERWGVGVYVNNMFNKRYVVSIGNDSTNDFGTPYATITPPRTFGVELRAKF
ncbi:TonB-dependent receptor [Dyella nitratireducens]|uniref:TonB-dependent receptor n=1 Tax=Dyella nitratireducens TaxID=1849580 RepID=A0ABQ1GVT0_9GAMM|nr:TonB-dependent receptor [Dyella nitratireducens]GGA50905.1 TonB-dependent receptor [Dyella nitratireducens]GLQ42655.1 TonB-dependent receptor [Dyella nitratireducens]